jgi:hypothetical protein
LVCQSDPWAAAPRGTNTKYRTASQLRLQAGEDVHNRPMYKGYRRCSVVDNLSWAGMTAEQILFRPIPDRWSTPEVVAHLADTEIYYTDRIGRTIVLERPLLMPAPQDQVPAGQRHAKHG